MRCLARGELRKGLRNEQRNINRNLKTKPNVKLKPIAEAQTMKLNKKRTQTHRCATVEALGRLLALLEGVALYAAAEAVVERLAMAINMQSESEV